MVKTKRPVPATSSETAMTESQNKDDEQEKRRKKCDKNLSLLHDATARRIERWGAEKTSSLLILRRGFQGSGQCCWLDPDRDK